MSEMFVANSSHQPRFNTYDNTQLFSHRARFNTYNNTQSSLLEDSFTGPKLFVVEQTARKAADISNNNFPSNPSSSHNFYVGNHDGGQDKYRVSAFRGSRAAALLEDLRASIGKTSSS